GEPLYGHAYSSFLLNQSDIVRKSAALMPEVSRLTGSATMKINILPISMLNFYIITQTNTETLKYTPLYFHFHAKKRKQRH
ncbi:MAG: hypothetical protein KGM99_12890, partial [Burkholderiales bacterium]|nr:hypothetical protein [Burkholderiales bacterium]